MISDAPALVQRPLIVELVGLAGVGKTTLLQTLSQQQPLQAGVTLPPLRQASFWLRNGMWLPICLAERRQWFTASELRSLVYLQAWHQTLIHDSRSRTTILDHGPIFRLAMLREFGSSMTQSSAFDAWWTEMRDRWAETLDVVIWLDAPDEVLLDRINRRDRGHAVKDQSQQAGCEFLRRYRRMYEEILAEMGQRSSLRVLRFESYGKSPEQLAKEILERVD